MSAPITEAHLELAKTVIFSRDASGRVLTAPMAAQIIADSEARACDQLRAEVERLRDGGVQRIKDAMAVVMDERDSFKARAERAEADLADIRALADRRNKRDHSQDTTHQLVAALDQALDIAQAELAATKSTLDEEVNCAEKAEHEVVRQYARAERAEAELHALRLVCGTTDADKFSTWVDRANTRAEKAEAELAKAKAVLASIEEDGTEEHNAAVGLRQELATERARIADLVADLNDACITLTSAEEDCDDYAMQNTRFKLTAVREVLLQHIPNAAMKEETK